MNQELSTTSQILARARRHAIELDKPAVNFFEGAVLGNGGLGVIVCTRPDAVVLHLGHNNVWDIRIAEEHLEKMLDFPQVFERIRNISPDTEKLTDDPWYAEYLERMTANYSKPYPRPFPCGTVLLGFDRREVELLGHTLDIADGLCKVRFLYNGELLNLEIFVSTENDQVWFRIVNEAGEVCNHPFNRIRLMPDAGTPKEFPPATSPDDLSDDVLSFRQILPPLPDAQDNAKGSRAFRVSVRASEALSKKTRRKWDGTTESMGLFEGALEPNTAPFHAFVCLEEGREDEVSQENFAVTLAQWPTTNSKSWQEQHATSLESWERFWSKSGVALADEFLEKVWYRNLYFLNCSVKPGVTCPGLFANWSRNEIGTAWHGDYHMNYNTQQPFWATFSSNHIEKHEPYVDLVHFLLPVSQTHARDYYHMRGAFFPHSAYPVPMSMMPFPTPDWGWEICETPWAVQSLWWHYLYTLDTEFLTERAFTPIREACLFLVDYISRPDARGNGPWGNDDHWHIFPTAPPEMHGGLRPGFVVNYDCNVDLTLTRFVLNAFTEACRVLNRQEEERDLLLEIEAVLQNLSPLPRVESPRYGTVWASVPHEDPESIFNTPNPLMSVFPGEEFGLASSPDILGICTNTWNNHLNEGGNELVFLAMQGVRLGLLDLEKWKRQIRYCELPNGTYTDMVLQTMGRYSDVLPFDFMAHMGIWFENFALPAPINECLLQSWDSTLRVFPNWPREQNAEFRTLRARGAFLVSARMEEGEVLWIEIEAEKGGLLRLNSPWPATRLTSNGQESLFHTSTLQVETHPAQKLRFQAK